MNADRFDAFFEALSDRTSRYAYGLELREEGRVASMSDAIARVTGLGGVRLDEVLEIGGRVPAFAMDLLPGEVGAVLLGGQEEVEAGATVRGTGRMISTPVGSALLGRVVDPVGRPLDGKGPVSSDEWWPVERSAPDIASREPVTEPLLTGWLVVDALFPIGRGQRQLILGDRGTGKSTLALDVVVNQRDQNVRCVYVAVGQMASEVVATLESLESHGARANTIVVVAGAETPPGLRFIAPYAGMTMAEYFRDRGEDVLIVFDDLHAHAVAYRELSLLLRRPPGREAFPGDIFFVHSRLLERATRLAPQAGGGSVTALPIVETRAGRVSDFIPTNLISITDGQLYLDAQLFDRGVKPAVDVGVSVSRVGAKTQRRSMQAVAGELRLEMARFKELEVFARFGARVEAETRARLQRGARARELLKQGPKTSLRLGEEVVLLAALEEGLFDSVTEREVGPMRDRLLDHLRRASAPMLRTADEGCPLSEEDRALLRRMNSTAG